MCSRDNDDDDLNGAREQAKEIDCMKFVWKPLQPLENYPKKKTSCEMWEFDSIARGARKLSTRAQERKERKVELTKTYANANLTLAASRELRSWTTGEEDDARKKWRREKKFSVHAFCMRSSLVHLSHFIYMLFFFLISPTICALPQLSSILSDFLSLSFSSLSSLLNFFYFFFVKHVFRMNLNVHRACYEWCVERDEKGARREPLSE